MTGKLKPDVTSLKDYMDWSEGGQMSLEFFGQINLTADLLIAASVLFWPEYVLYEDCIFREGFSEQRVKEWIEILNGDLSAVERMCNHVHLAEDFLRNIPDEALSDDNLRYLNDVFVEMWGAELRTQFPDRDIGIEGTLQEHGDYIITFWQHRESE